MLAAISLQHPGIEFGAVDVDELQSVAQRWGVSAMPTFIVFRGGTPFRTIVGADMKALAAALDEAGAAAPFSGGGRTLGGGGGAAAAAPAPAPATASGPATVDAAGLDEAKPVLTVTVRLASGDQMAVRLNAGMPVSALAAASGGRALVDGFPPRSLDPGAVVDALAGALVTQR